MHYRNYRWLAKQLYKGKTQKEIASICNVHVGTIETWVRKFKLQGIKNKTTSNFKFSDPYFAYLIGLFVTDGYYNPHTKIVEITLQKKDYKILARLANYYSATLKYYKNTARLYFSKLQSDHFSTVTGYIPGAKTFLAYVPDKFPSLLHKYIIRGIIDGDGTIRKNGNIRIYSESLSLLEFCEKYFKTNNLQYSYQENNKILYIKDSIPAGIKIYNSFPELCISRKRDRISKIVNDIVRTHEMINHEKWCN